MNKVGEGERWRVSGLWVGSKAVPWNRRGVRWLDHVATSWFMAQPLEQAFFARDTRDVARELLGCELVAGEVHLRVVETEAYIPGDSANHSFRGRTPRNAPMWGAPGHLYVYLCYGIHHLLNVVTEQDGQPAAVLIRGCTVVAGHETVRTRRKGRLDLIGPGKVAQALGADTTWSGSPLGEHILVQVGEPPASILATPRVGIDYAQPEHRDALWRYLVPPKTGSTRKR